MATDFFDSPIGYVSATEWRRYGRLVSLVDAAYDWRLAAANRMALDDAMSLLPQKVLIAAVEVPGRENDLKSVIQLLSASKIHRVQHSVVAMGQRGKFDNINLALDTHDLSDFDWIVIADDDVSLPANFLDLFLYYCVRSELKLAMPAHKLLSYKTYAITERNWASTVRLTNFVEIGPVTIIHRDTFALLIPFPSLRYAWGLDVLWSDIAVREAWKIGVVDATPVKHLRPIAGSYSGDAARNEAVAFLEKRGVVLTKADIMSKNVKV